MLPIPSDEGDPFAVLDALDALDALRWAEDGLPLWLEALAAVEGV